jgi:hypothetical protein
MRATLGMLTRFLMCLFCFAVVSYCHGCSSSDGYDDAGELEQLEHDARQVDDGKGHRDAGELEHDAGEQLEHDAGEQLEHDAGEQLEHDAAAAAIDGVWQVSRTRVEPGSPLDVCKDAFGNVRDPSAVETWTVGSKVEGSKLGAMTYERAGPTLELRRVPALAVEGFVRLTGAATFEGSIRVTGNAPTASNDGWRTCTTTQTVRGWR